MSAEPLFSIVAIRCLERPVSLRLPFRFGAATVTHAPQLFVRACIRLGNGRETWGAAAELMVPQWFDKNPALTEAQSFDQLRLSVALAREAYLADRTPRTGFGHFAAHYSEHLHATARCGIPALAAGFGPAEIDKALIDALARALGHSFADVVRANLADVAPAPLLPEFEGFDFSAFLGNLTPRHSMTIRHTVGLLDRIAGHSDTVHDGLPESLEEAIAVYGLRVFKIKLCGRFEEDLARLSAIAEVLNRGAPDYRVTLDGNEQYCDPAELDKLWRALARSAALTLLRERILFIEQPMARSIALECDVHACASILPMIIDESDATLESYPRAAALGYRGVSSKACKGLYKSLINLARCKRWNDEGVGLGRPGYFMSAEDLTTQAGLAVQQDLGLCAMLGVTHVERNGHHYVNGFAGQGAPMAEQEAFLGAHPDLYQRADGTVRFRIEDGRVMMGSLAAPGFASSAAPDWTSMSPMPESGEHRFAEPQRIS